MQDEDYANTKQPELAQFETVPIDDNPNKEEDQQFNQQPTQQPETQDTPDMSQTVIPEETPEYLSPEKVEQQADYGDAEMYIDEGGGKKKWLIILGAGIVLFILLFVIYKVVKDRLDEQKEVNLTYWGLWESEQVIKPLIEEYQKKNPKVKITYEMRDPKLYRTKLFERIKEERGPDIFRYHNTWLSSIIDITSPLPKSIMDNAEFEKTFYKVAHRDLNYNGTYYGIPLMIDGLVLVYNDELLKSNGFNSPPETWDQIIKEYAPELTLSNVELEIVTSGISLGTANNIEHFSDIFGLILLQAGGNITNLTSSQAIDSLKFYRSFAESPNNYWDESMPNNINAFAENKVAMILVPSWQILNIKNLNSKISLKVTKVPRLIDNNNLTIANYWVEGVSKISKNQPEAWKFLKFLSEKESLAKLYKEQTNQRLFGEPYSRVDMQSMLANDEYLGPIMEQAPTMQSLPLISRTFDDGINDEIVAYLLNAINTTARGASYQSALQSAKTGIGGILTKYKYK